MISPNTILRERYRIIHELGHGGMGTIYQAMDESLSCIVAVKETLATTDEQRRAFRREAELLANLSHPTLPKVMDHFTHDEGQFLVMQFVPGHDLAELMALRAHPFPVETVLNWADQLLDALTELHSSDPPIVHRDIKPSNLKVTPRGRILLLDFGLAKGVAGQMTTADVGSRGDSIYGYTAHYAPLEQIRRAGTDQRSDLYSLAATMWTLLTNEVPPDALSRVSEKEDGNPDPLRPAHEKNPEVPLTVSTALNRAMALNRNHRQSNAIELRKELSNALAELEEQFASQEQLGTRAASRDQPPALGSTIRSPEPEPAKLADDQPVPTVQLPTAAASTQERVRASSTATSFASEAPRQPGRRKHFALMAGGALLLVFAVAIGFWIAQRPRTSEQSVNSGNSIQTSTGTTTSLSDTNRPTAPTGMVYVSGGTFTMGRENGDDSERPPHQATVKPFFIDAYEVSNDEYEKFVKATNHRAPPSWQNGSYPSGAGRKPVVGVSWDDASEYARWAGRRLPTEEEWEFAARGVDGRLYPWGNDWRQGSANANGADQAVADVGGYKSNSPFGTADMVGNAWEWTASSFKPYPGRGLPSSPPATDLRVIRGGCYESTKDYATTTYRAGWPARGAPTYEQTGFRLAKDIE